MEYLYLTPEQNELLQNITSENTSNMIIKSLEYNDGFIVPSDVLDEPHFHFYKPLLLSLEKIIIE